MKYAKWIRMTATAAGLSVVPLFAVVASAAPQVQQQGQVAFVSGGVGEEELQEIKKLSPNYPLELLFATKGTPDKYLSGVKVQIADKDGKVVLDTQSKGPFLLAKLPPGRYAISADSEGEMKKRQTVQVGSGKSQRVVFVWNQPAD